jgi:hypothetical protein
MSIRSSLRSFAVVALIVGSSSVAFARRPPALDKQQQSQGHAQPASGYRDSLVRARATGTAAAAGYRDSLVRFASSRAAGA